MRPPIPGEGGSAATRAPLFARAGACACAIALLAAAGARPGEPREGGDASPADPKAKSPPEQVAPAEREPVCRVKIADKRGFVMAGLLLALEDGVYHVRGPDKKDIELREGDVSSVRFSPLKEPRSKIAKAKPPKPRHPGRPEGREYRPPPGAERRGKEFVGRFFRDVAERRAQWNRLDALNAQGKLDGHVRRLRANLVNARNMPEAMKILAEINMARNVKQDPLKDEEIQRLVDTIADPNVSAQTAGPARILLRPLGPQRRGPGERRGGPWRRRPEP
ncbi:MAG: hypothetical protein ACYSU0_06695 [Planctomycetota bacterium]|jgi:hypothetical protein